MVTNRGARNYLTGYVSMKEFIFNILLRKLKKQKNQLAQMIRDPVL